MVRNSTHEEFARWLEYLMAIVPSHSVDTPNAGSQKKEQTRSARNRADQLHPVRPANGTNRDLKYDEQATALTIRSGLGPMEHESQIWDD
jgi:hypothetical protein